MTEEEQHTSIVEPTSQNRRQQQHRNPKLRHRTKSQLERLDIRNPKKITPKEQTIVSTEERSNESSEHHHHKNKQRKEEEEEEEEEEEKLKKKKKKYFLRTKKERRTRKEREIEIKRRKEELAEQIRIKQISDSLIEEQQANAVVIAEFNDVDPNAEEEEVVFTDEVISNEEKLHYLLRPKYKLKKRHYFGFSEEHPKSITSKTTKAAAAAASTATTMRPKPEKLQRTEEDDRKDFVIQCFVEPIQIIDESEEEEEEEEEDAAGVDNNGEEKKTEKREEKKTKKSEASSDTDTNTDTETDPEQEPKKKRARRIVKQKSTYSLRTEKRKYSITTKSGRIVRVSFGSEIIPSQQRQQQQQQQKRNKQKVRALPHKSRSTVEEPPISTTPIQQTTASTQILFLQHHN